jgi:hypothetical protein
MSSENVTVMRKLHAHRSAIVPGPRKGAIRVTHGNGTGPNIHVRDVRAAIGGKSIFGDVMAEGPIGGFGGALPMGRDLFAEAEERAVREEAKEKRIFNIAIVAVLAFVACSMAFGKVPEVDISGKARALGIGRPSPADVEKERDAREIEQIKKRVEQIELEDAAREADKAMGGAGLNPNVRRNLEMLINQLEEAVQTSEGEGGSGNPQGGSEEASPSLDRD